jgi:pimeloyl-ACP methyl ester carboxylesterase
LTQDELAAIRIPTMFIWGSDEPYLSLETARPSIERIPAATVHELSAGHGPWLVHPESVARLIDAHLHGRSLGPGSEIFRRPAAD